jgi:hypothetical protein
MRQRWRERERYRERRACENVMRKSEGKLLINRPKEERVQVIGSKARGKETTRKTET